MVYLKLLQVYASSDVVGEEASVRDPLSLHVLVRNFQVGSYEMI